MILYDNEKRVDIEMRCWDGTSYGPDISGEFFDELLPDEDGCYHVNDVDYCVDQAYDWQNGEGDYLADPENYLPFWETEEGVELPEEERWETAYRLMREDINSRTVDVTEL